MNLGCIQCLQNQALHAVQLLKGSEELQEQVLRGVMKRLLVLEWNRTPIELAQEVHQIIKAITRVPDPYLTVKTSSNDLVLKYYTTLKAMVTEHPEPLKTAVKLAIAGNIIDYGAFRTFNIEQTIHNVLDTNLTLDDYQTFQSKFDEAETLLFFADNAGEIVFDKLLLETMMKEKPFQHISFVVKGGAILNDATLNDVQSVGLSSVPALEVKTLSNGEPGTGPLINSSEVKQWIETHDLTIVKGQGNYEGLSDVPGIFFALIAKCAVVALDLGVHIHDIVFKFNP